MDGVVLPPSIRERVEGYAMEAVEVGESGARVFRLARDGGAAMFLKCAPGTELGEEVERLRWLVGRAPVPPVIHFEAGFLLMGALPGRDGSVAGHPAAVVAGLAGALRELHAQPVEGCPFDHRVDAQIERARLRMEAGLVDEDDFDEARIGRSAAELFEGLRRTRPAGEDLVLAHGDACLPNVLFDGTRFAGFIDCGRAGVADRYQDLALASRSIEHNLGAEWVEPFFAAYGLPAPRAEKIEFYRLLDEFF